MPRQLNTEPVNFLPADHPAFRIQLPSHVEPMPPTVPFYRADGSRVDPIEAAWQPPEPAKDWRTRMHEALSDKNIRYYAGPGFSQFLENLAGLVPMLPGSGMVESQQDAREARNDFESGNYGKAAAHLASGTANVGLDVLPGGKVLAGILGGISARTFPWAKRPIAEAMERAGRSADEIWQSTNLVHLPDGSWRFRISPLGYRVNTNAGRLDADGSRVAKLFEHHRWPALQDAYPQLAEAESRIRINPNREARGEFAPGIIRIEVPTPLLARSTGIHELDHMVGHLERFPRGGSPWEFMFPGVSKEQADILYKRLAGEVSADNAVYRLFKLTEKERQLKAPSSTWDVPWNQQIIRYHPEGY
jgi:hypothetical protein